MTARKIEVSVVSVGNAPVTGPLETRGDRLAQIEKSATDRIEPVRNPRWTAVPLEDVLALVEIAKAARDIVESIEEAEGFRYVGSEDDIDMLHALADALARLNSGAAEGDA